MITFFWRRFLLPIAALAPFVLAMQPACVDAQTQRVGTPRTVSQSEVQKEKMNAWTVGLAGGLLEGAPLRLAAEMARVVDDGPNLHVLPIVTRGAKWKSINLAATVPGLDRFPAAQEWLDRQARAPRASQ
jgi:hypothetical protein